MEKVQHPPLLFEKSAAHFGYMPWVQFSFVHWLVFRKAIKNETFELMNRCLKDPSKAHPVWAFHFAKAIEDIGLAECESAEELHSFVTMHVQYRKVRKSRKAYKDAVKKQTSEMGAMIALMPSEDAAIIKEDIARRAERKRIENAVERKAKAAKKSLEKAGSPEQAPPNSPASSVAVAALA